MKVMFVVLPSCLLLLAGGCSRSEPVARPAGPEVILHVLDAEPGLPGLRGQVRFKGAPPALRPVDMSSDVTCLSGHDPKDVPDNSFMVTASGEEGIWLLANAFVWVEGHDFPDEEVEPLGPVVIDQKGCQYRPRVSGVRAGQSVRVLNSDQTMHNVHNRASRGGFNRVMLADADPLEMVFEKEEMVQLRCDVHPWMRAFIGVVPHAYHAVSRDDGGFTLPSLPAGTYTLRAWHELLGTSGPMELTISEGARELQIDFARR